MRRRAVLGVEDSGPFPGRHASRNEIAAETPIFHALTVGGWRSRQHEPAAPPAAARPARRADPVSEFRQDPLTAPIPVQALVATPAPAPVPMRPAPVPASMPSNPMRMSSQRGADRRPRHSMPFGGVEDSGRHHQYSRAGVGAAVGW